MLKAIILLLSFSAIAAQEYATLSVQRWDQKLVVSIAHDEGWHTYWKNPGDAGLPTQFKFSPETKAYEWPLPKKYIEAGDILTIGHGGIKHFFFDDIKGTFDLKVNFLICKDICIPGEEKLKLGALETFTATKKINPYPNSVLEKAWLDLPQKGSLPKGFEFYLTKIKDKPLLNLHYQLKDIKDPILPLELNLLTPFPQAPWGFKREDIYFKDGVLYGKTEIEWDGEYQEPPMALPESGQFSKPHELTFLLNAPGMKNPEVVSLKMDQFSIQTKSLDDFYKNLPSLKSTVKELPANSSSTNIFYYLALAFLGGLILNLMPCVLPVISLKLFGLIKNKNLSQKNIFLHNLSYTSGVVSTFMILGGVIAAIKAGGEEIGWGFQLQSPTFVLIMMVVLFILTMNLFGLFEFITPGGTKLGSTQTKSGLTGDFFSGILTTILSTPCSAPFLGTALTFAFTTSTTNIFLIFFLIAIGLSFPFILTSLFPSSLALFPRPGMWMERLKYFLGLSVLITLIWLYDVFVSLVNFDPINWRLNLLFAAWFFAFFFAQKISKHRFIQFFIFIIPVVMTTLAIQNLELKKIDDHFSETKQSEWGKWSESALAENLGKNVFMDFTAEWCLTCKINKKFVMETNGFKQMAQKHNLVLLRADWTKRDDNITLFLKRYNLVGVPAYFIQKPDGKIIFLGETISVGEIEEKLK